MCVCVYLAVMCVFGCYVCIWLLCVYLAVMCVFGCYVCIWLLCVYLAVMCVHVLLFMKSSYDDNQTSKLLLHALQFRSTRS